MLASVVIKIEYRRALQQELAQAPRQSLMVDSLAATKSSISRLAPAFLTGSGLQTEMVVTHSKQTTETFLTGSRIARQRSDCRDHFMRFLSELSALSTPTTAVVDVSLLPLQILSNPLRLCLIQGSPSASWR
jgi:hypothetical protein